MTKTLLERMGFDDPDRNSPEHDQIVLDLLAPKAFAEACAEPLKDLFAIQAARIWRSEDTELVARLKDYEFDPLDYEMDVRSEVPVKNGKGYLVGHIDVRGEAVRHRIFGPVNGKAHPLFVEVKTRIYGFGETLRQLETYRDCVPTARIVLVTPEGMLEDRMAEAFRGQYVYLHQVPLRMPELICRNCGSIETETAALAWRRFADGRLHIEARCTGCRAWIAWVPQVEAALRRAGPPPTDIEG